MIKKSTTTITLLLCIYLGWSQEQEVKFGIGYQVYPYEGIDIKFESGSEESTYNEFVEGKTESLNFMIGYKYPVYKFSDNLHLNLHGELNGVMWIDQQSDTQNFQGQTLASGSSGGVFGFQTPVYAAVAYQPDLIQNLSVEGGFGIMYSGINNGIETPFKGSYIPPFYTVALRYFNLQLKFVQTFTKFKDSYPTNGQEIPRLEVSNYSFHLVAFYQSWF